MHEYEVLRECAGRTWRVGDRVKMTARQATFLARAGFVRRVEPVQPQPVATDD